MPQILIGSDKVILFPRPVIGKDRNPVETKTARLLKSVISGRYLAHGFEEPDQTVELVNSDQSATQEDETEAQAAVSHVGSLAPVGSINQVEETAETMVGSVHIDIEDITDDIRTISSEDDSDAENGLSGMVERVQIHSPRPICNADGL